VTWATSVPILVFLGLSTRVRDDVRDRQTDRRQPKASINASALLRLKHNNCYCNYGCNYGKIAALALEPGGLGFGAGSPHSLVLKSVA